MDGAENVFWDAGGNNGGLMIEEHSVHDIQGNVLPLSTLPVPTMPSQVLPAGFDSALLGQLATSEYAIDWAGNVSLTGTAVGPVDLGGAVLAPIGALDVVVAKFDAAGQHQWSRRFQASGSDAALVKNQFFAMILTPDQPGNGVRIERVKVNPLLPADSRAAYGVTAYAQFDLKPLAAGASTTFGASYYAGPKEYKRFANTDVFKHHEEKVMQFSSGIGKIFFSGFFAPLLLTIMNWVHSLVPSWGWAIVITTLILKIVFLPLTLAASRSAKRMAKLQPHMQAMREKFKDNPQKMQTETLRLFKENKVNPVGGCIPILITIPFFIGFFTMLQSASELRFAPFLWAHDLSAPDTIYSFGAVTLPLLGLTHLNVNIMPILMGATMIFQMKLTPTPTTDPAQQVMFKVMPWIFTLFCYTFASGLALYSTINGLFTIGQQMVINRMPEPDLPINNGGAKPAVAGAVKNVTPRKKRG